MRSKVSSKSLIIECAEELIKKDGLESFTSRNLCKEANLALGTLYNYFDSRDDLLEEVFILSWTKTKEELLRIQQTNLDVKEKMYQILVALGKDVNNRRGLGAYIMEKTNQNVDDLHKRYSFFEDIVTSFMTVLKESPLHKNDSKEELKTIAMWILFGHISFMKRNEDMNIFYKQVVKNLL